MDSRDGGIIKTEGLLAQISERKMAEQIMELAPYAARNGLALTEDMAAQIASARRQILKRTGRVEINGDASARLVRAFIGSRSWSQDDFSYVIGEMMEIFHWIRNEIRSALTDDDLISELLEVFDYTCNGDVELMQSKGVEKILRRLNLGDEGIWEEYEDKGRERWIGYEEDWRE